MTVDDKIADKKLQYNINIVVKINKLLAISSGKIDKFEYLTDKEILPSDQIRII